MSFEPTTLTISATTGAHRCIPCAAVMPAVDTYRPVYAGQPMDVVFLIMARAPTLIPG